MDQPEFVFLLSLPAFETKAYIFLANTLGFTLPTDTPTKLKQEFHSKLIVCLPGGPQFLILAQVVHCGIQYTLMAYY